MLSDASFAFSVKSATSCSLFVTTEERIRIMQLLAADGSEKRFQWILLQQCPFYLLVVSPSQLWEIGQLLDPDDGIVEGGLQGLCHRVGEDHGYHHRQDVRDLPSQLEHNHRSGNCMGDRSWQRCCTCSWATGWWAEQKEWASVDKKILHSNETLGQGSSIW